MASHSSNNQKHLAVMIDADNAPAAIVEGLFEEIANGVASVKRIYGDWTGPQLRGWKKVLLDHSIQPIQQFAYTKGKNATDSSLIIDAMDLLYTRRFDTRSRHGYRYGHTDNTTADQCSGLQWSTIPRSIRR